MKLSIIIPNHNEPKIQEMKDSVYRCFPYAEIIVSNDPCGNGKGWAIRQGIRASTGDILCFIDGDRDIEAVNIIQLLHYISDYDVVVAKKRLEYLKFQRKLVSLGYRLLIRLLFNLPFETQTGLKIWKREALQSFESNGFEYDVEMLYKAHKAGLKIKEVPISAYITKKLGLKTIWKTLKATIQVRFRL